MQTKRGIPVSPGVAIGRAVVVDAEDRPVPRRVVAPSQVDAEIARLEEALSASIAELKKLQSETESRIGVELARIFTFHLGILQDKHLTDQFRKMIREQWVTAEHAVFMTMRAEARKLRQVEGRLFQERVKDVWDLERRILGHLIGRATEALANLPHEAIVVAHDLTPSQTAGLDKDRVKALATDAGGRTSHTAILAHALGIPAIVGLEDLTSRVDSGDTLIVDAGRGVVIVEPDASQLMQYREELAQQQQQQVTLAELADEPAVTTDGVDVKLLANIEFPHEVGAALAQGADGIGLYRTEFLYLASELEPTEDQHYDAYVEALYALDGRPLVVRTLDLGADKMSDGMQYPGERNPFLGCRSIRLCLQNLPLFKTQLRAVLRASVEGDMRVMFPLISSVMELRQARMILSDVMEDLAEEGVPFREDIPVGMMVEVPSAALQIRSFLPEVDFVSIGTNDLIQYTVAVDRGNERIANLYSPAHPAVIQLIRDVVRAANRAKVEVSLCGEMGGEPEFIMLLLGIGLRAFSVTPPAVPAVKRVVRSASINQCQRIARRVASLESDREIQNYLREELKRIVPGAVGGRSIE